MAACIHERQATVWTGETDGDMVTVKRVFPCATPACTETIPDRRLVFWEGGATRRTYDRVETPSGWRWKWAKTERL